MLWYHIAEQGIVYHDVGSLIQYKLQQIQHYDYYVALYSIRVTQRLELHKKVQYKYKLVLYSLSGVYWY